MRLLEGAVMPDVDDELRDLREQNRQLSVLLRDARTETAIAQRESARALGALRQQLSPLYRALQAVFGEIDAAGIADDGAAPANPRIAAVWESWKQKMGGHAGQIIGVLQLHREMTAQQIAIAIGIHKKNVPQLVHKLKKNGLINKNGDKFSLKEL